MQKEEKKNPHKEKQLNWSNISRTAQDGGRSMMANIIRHGRSWNVNEQEQWNGQCAHEHCRPARVTDKHRSDLLSGSHQDTNNLVHVEVTRSSFPRPRQKALPCSKDAFTSFFLLSPPPPFLCAYLSGPQPVVRGALSIKLAISAIYWIIKGSWYCDITYNYSCMQLTCS